ncbi:MULTISPECIES: hypothetical protein [Lysobacter]|uniref:Bacterial extracellular solute-binding family protein n=1 Tax=Lysobacter gummosus TaxID=262324 RepID=A0ABY3X4Y8_9GAMM|nr:MULTISPECIES: hypothetical protein [Lysobacter]ALN91985.1 hypothetical protein LG3211_3023 [Lysobacter gummosus]UJB21045.1 hypothetical protein L1A79_08320 [Lysobacter capsici]UJQ29840.1 hypothetical protein L2D09_06540 [Lysobacter gummosus]UNP27632.1 hypothetical protein MOV92_13975 [Lysobacter gummosus]
MRKILGPALAVVLLAGVVIGIVLSFSGKRDSDRAAAAADQAQAAAANRITVRVLTGSEKLEFLRDPELAQALLADNIVLDVQKAGSREIATRPDLKTFDAAYPAGAAAARKIAAATGSRRVFNSYYTPMTVASWKPLLPTLEANGIVGKKGNAYFIVDMRKLVALMEQGTRWKDLQPNPNYSVSKSVLITSTDVRTSNSAAMYLALASYLANGDDVVANEAGADQVADRLVHLFSKQGYQESSSSGPFEDYVTMKMGKSPLVMIYEQQFLEYAFKHKSVDPDMVLLYPQPTVLTKHTIVALNDKGARFAEAFERNPKVQAIAARYGLRGPDNAALFDDAKARGIEVPQSLVDVVDPPTYDILERMISRIETKLGH